MIHDLDEKLFKTKVFDYDKGDDAPLLIKNDTVIEFWVTWCPHCQAMMPRYEKVSEEYPSIDCYRVEMEQHPAIANQFNIEAFPAFVFIDKDGNMKKWVGEIPTEELATFVKEAFHY